MWQRLALLLVALLTTSLPGFADEGRVVAVYFSSPHCPYCALVSERDLDPLQATHQDTLRLVTIDTSTPEGSALLEQVWSTLDVPRSRRGVPTILLGDELLVGAREIPERLPGLFREAQAAGGLGLPSLPGLEEHAASSRPSRVQEPSVLGRVQNDVPGNYVAIALMAILIVLALASIPPGRWQEDLSARTPRSIKILVAAVGLGAALYLSWGETTQQDLVCGPIGQCNVVQHSDMAMLWGLGPLAVMGAIGYAIILGIYLFGWFGPERLARWTPAVLLLLSGPGFLFSILLTFWQPFVIGATCTWCLISAITMTLTCLLSLGPGRSQIRSLLKSKAP